MNQVMQIKPLSEIIQQKHRLYDSLSFNLTKVRNDEEICIQGDFLYIVEAPVGINGNIKFNETLNDSIPVKRGRRYSIPFYRFFLTNSGQSGTITILVGKDLNAFDFAEEGVISIDAIDQPIQLRGVDNLDVATSPVTVIQVATLLVASRTRRHTVTLYNEGNNSARIGKADVIFTSQGILLQPGASMTSNFTGAVYAICGAGLSTLISFMDEYSN